MTNARLVVVQPRARTRISPHFVAGEFACPHCRAIVVDEQLLRLLERARRHAGRPLVIHSGYRCPVHNRQVGGAMESQHLYGRAADVPIGYLSANEWEALGAIGIEVRPQGVSHVDVRPGHSIRFPP